MISIQAENHQNKLKMLQKIGSKHFNTDKNVFPGHLFRARRLLDLSKFPLSAHIQFRVLTQFVAFSRSFFKYLQFVLLFASFVLIFEEKQLILVAYVMPHYKSFQIFSLKKSKQSGKKQSKMEIFEKTSGKCYELPNNTGCLWAYTIVKTRIYERCIRRMSVKKG